VVFITGGPGLGAATTPGYALRALEELRDSRDVLFIDQRGTGRSNPLDCALYADDGRSPPYVGPMFPVDRVRACREVLEEHADLTQYTTAQAVDDLHDVIRALGYERVNLLAVSYGTRVALSYLRRYPEQVRAAILHGVVPPDEPIPLGAAHAADRALEHQFAACAADSACAAAVPDPRGDFRVVLARLRRGPAPVQLWSWERLKYEQVAITARGFAEWTWAALYQPSGGRNVLALVHRAAANDWVPLARAAVHRSRRRSAGRSEGMALSVLCTEDAPRLAQVDTTRAAAGRLLGLPAVHELLRACAVWPRGIWRAEESLPLVSDTPVLLLSGGLDPVTPPELADRPARSLPNSLHIVMLHRGHGELEACGRESITAFMRTGDVRLLRRELGFEPAPAPGTSLSSAARAAAQPSTHAQGTCVNGSLTSEDAEGP